MTSIANILPIIQSDFPYINFTAGENFFWSPKDNKITYTSHQMDATHGVWALLHEVAHADLNHQHYLSDFELLQLEIKAWQHAKTIGKKYHIEIEHNHIQDCLDTYRDWLHLRAKCPKCTVISLQRPDSIYQCFNCKTTWQVPKSPLCRVTRQIIS
jgi:hypothetical protein